MLVCFVRPQLNLEATIRPFGRTCFIQHHTMVLHEHGVRRTTVCFSKLPHCPVLYCIAYSCFTISSSHFLFHFAVEPCILESLRCQLCPSQKEIFLSSPQFRSIFFKAKYSNIYNVWPRNWRKLMKCTIMPRLTRMGQSVDRSSFFLISARVDWKFFLPMLTLGKSVVNLTLGKSQDWHS